MSCRTPSPRRGGGVSAFAGGVAAVVVLVVPMVAFGAAAAQSPTTDPPTSATSTTVPADGSGSIDTTVPTTSAPDHDPAATTSTVVAQRPSDPGSTTTVPVSSDAPAVEPPGSTAPSGDGAAPATTLPSEPPEGFSEEQFRTFVGVVTACGPDPGVVCSRILAWTGNRTLAEASQWVSEVPVRILVVLAVALLANALVRKGIQRYVERLDRRASRKDDRDGRAAERRTLRVATASTTLASAASVAIFTSAVVVALAQVDISLGPLLAGAGILGVALGFGAQNVVRDVLAGIFVLVEDQYGIGDVIDVGRASGSVEGISLRVTKLRDVEGTLWFVPNGLVNEVGNLTQRWARVILDIGVAYGADHHRAERLIKEAADSLWADEASGVTILDEPELWGVEQLGESAVNIRVAVRCTPSDQWVVGRALRSRIKDRLDLAGIEIPYPQQSVWIRSEPDRRPVRT